MAELHAPYPMLFAADFKEKVWGSRRLESWFEDMPPRPAPIGEAWVLSAHPNGPTGVSNGRLAGQTLAEIYPEFPLLVKVLSCEDDLSVQVHPPDHYPHLSIGESGKSEVWLVLEAAPGASIIHGLAEGVTPTGRRHLDGSEAIEIELLSVAEAVRLALSGGMIQAMHVGLMMIGLNAAGRLKGAL